MTTRATSEMRVTGRKCEGCGKPKGCVPFAGRGYWHPACFRKGRNAQVAEPIRSIVNAVSEPRKPEPVDVRPAPAPEPRIPCADCGPPIPEPGENPDPAALLCDSCHEKAKPRIVAECWTCKRMGEWRRPSELELCRNTGHDVRPAEGR